MTRIPRHRLVWPSWLRLPGRTARVRFTLLSGALFLLAGAALLGVTYLLFEQGTQGNASGGGGTSSSGRGPLPGVFRGGPPAANQALGAAQRAAAEAQVASDRHVLLVDLGIALVVVAALALLLGWFFAGHMLRPVRTITATARRISASNLHERLALDGADEEFKQLGDTLDDLFARLDAAFEAQRHFVANASHELRTPLTRERALLQVALSDPSTSDVWRSTGQDLLASNREQERLIEALLALASSESGLDHKERIDLATVCDDVLARPNPDTDRLGIQVDTAIRSAPLEGDPRLIERLVTNLIDNAVSHNTAGGRVQISTSLAGESAVLSVTNTGPTIAPGDVDRLFRPFQRLDPARTHHKDGHGLGLSIVAAIASAHGATITAHPRPAGGLHVEVIFRPPAGDDAPRNGLDASGPTRTPRPQGISLVQPAPNDHREDHIDSRSFWSSEVN